MWSGDETESDCIVCVCECVCVCDKVTIGTFLHTVNPCVAEGTEMKVNCNATLTVEKQEIPPQTPEACLATCRFHFAAPLFLNVDLLCQTVMLCDKNVFASLVFA